MTGPKTERDDNATRISVFMPWGFHGDHHLLALVDQLAANVNHFIETGTEAGSTVAYMGRMYPHLTCWTCEADHGTHELAKKNTSNIPNILHSNKESQEWLQGIDKQDGLEHALFWLDAHSHGFGCPLGLEVNTLLSRWSGGYILMDDFQVPNRPDYGFDWYNTFGKVNWETVVKYIEPDNLARITQAFYPNYPAEYNTRGWMLLVFGDAPQVKIAEDVADGWQLETGSELLQEQQNGDREE